MIKLPKKIAVGLDMLHYAIMTDETQETYGTPVAIPGSIQATITPTTNSATLYADDKAYEVATSLGDIAFVLNVADIPSVDHAALLGHTIDANGVVVRASSDNAPYVAIGYRRRMANGEFRYIWLYKGKFQPEAQDATTKADTPAFQTPTINATFIPRDTDSQWQAVVNQGDPGVLAATLTNWFTNVYLTANDTTAPTVAVAPADDATAVAVAANIVWTFSEAIRAALVDSSNFMVLDSTLNPVAGTLSIDATNMIVTFNPTANLTAATSYTAIVTTNIKDLAGNALAAPSITTFTTA